MGRTRRVEVGGLFENDAMLPAQVPLRHGVMTPEKRLMVAVLEDAWSTLRGKWRQSQHGERGRQEAMEWFQSNDIDWPFSFANICDVIGLDADAVRTQLHRMDWMPAVRIEFTRPRGRDRVIGSVDSRASALL